MALNYSYTQTRDGIITRALRIIGAIGQGETPDATAVSEAAVALNDLVKEWQADGMPLWAIGVWTLTPTEGQAVYTIPSQNVIYPVAPLKVFQAWVTDSASNSESEINIVTRQQYQMLGNKDSQGTPNQVWFDVPGNNPNGIPISEARIYPVPDANFVTYGTIKFSGQKPFQNFNAATDVPDFPQYWHNSLVWGLADQLSYEYGVAFAGRSMITKKALFHKEQALSFGTEEGSMLVQPMPSWDTE